jgi:uncharacterized protein DUF3616
LINQTAEGMAMPSLNLAFLSQRKLILASILASICSVSLLAGGPAVAEICNRSADNSWTVAPDFRGDKARTQLSGAACNESLSRCIAANDEKIYAQLFTVSGSRIIPDASSVDLIATDDEPDTEGAAYASGSFYITGSHGNSRRKNKPNEQSYVVVRVNAASGKVDARSTKWRGAIFKSAKLGPYAGQRLKDGGPGGAGGANVEGIAVWNDRMYLGFRGPSVGNNAYALSAPLREVFDNPGTELNARDHEIALGKRTGIRDLAAVDSGLLILTGPVNEPDGKDPKEEAPVRSIFHWNPETGKLDLLAQLDPLPPDVKAETLVVLPNDGDKARFRALLIFEGIANGGPFECSFSRPKE